MPYDYAVGVIFDNLIYLSKTQKTQQENASSLSYSQLITNEHKLIFSQILWRKNSSVTKSSH